MFQTVCQKPARDATPVPLGCCEVTVTRDNADAPCTVSDGAVPSLSVCVDMARWWCVVSWVLGAYRGELRSTCCERSSLDCRGQLRTAKSGPRLLLPYRTARESSGRTVPFRVQLETRRVTDSEEEQREQKCSPPDLSSLVGHIFSRSKSFSGAILLPSSSLT